MLKYRFAINRGIHCLECTVESKQKASNRNKSEDTTLSYLDKTQINQERPINNSLWQTETSNWTIKTRLSVPEIQPVENWLITRGTGSDRITASNRARPRSDPLNNSNAVLICFHRTAEINLIVGGEARSRASSKLDADYLHRRGRFESKNY